MFAAWLFLAFFGLALAGVPLLYALLGTTVGAIVVAGRERLRAKLSYTNLGFALAPATFTLGELRDVYVAALGHDVSPTNLRRVLERRRSIAPTTSTWPPL